MARNYRWFDQDFREGAVRLVEETGKPVAQVAKDLGINAGTLSNWVGAARRAQAGNDVLSEDERQELLRLRRENAELRMQRDVLKRSLVLWVNDSQPSEQGAVHRRSEDRARHPGRDVLPGAGCVPGLV